MGIGNTTTSSAIATVLLDKSVEVVTGRGAGLDNDGLERKINAIKKAIEINKPNKDDVIDVLAKVGGLDIAGMVGLFIGGAAVRLPVMLDGFISGISALIANEICPLCKEYMIASHISAEPAGLMLLEKLEFAPIVAAGMRLGEGTGAMAALTVIDMAIEVYNKAITFAEVHVKDYVHFV
jgi:nicotinate-nucleotide--dimethylbenzimidazole phosphoribosyltransferase